MPTAPEASATAQNPPSPSRVSVQGLFGRSSPLILDNLGLTVKVGDANKTYAEKLGKTVEQLTEAEKKTAFYEAALEAARVKVEQIGGIQLTFGDQVQRVVVVVTNMTDKLSMMISKSPMLMAGMEAAGKAIGDAFGGKQETLILGVVNGIEKAALIALEFGQTALSIAGYVSRGFASIKAVVLTVQVGFTALSEAIMGNIATVFEAAASIPVLGNAWKLQAEGARFAADMSGSLNAQLKEQQADALIAAAGNDTLGMSLKTASLALEQTRVAMVNAGLSQKELAVDTVAGVEANALATGALESYDAPDLMRRMNYPGES